MEHSSLCENDQFVAIGEELRLRDLSHDRSREAIFRRVLIVVFGVSVILYAGSSVWNLASSIGNRTHFILHGLLVVVLVVVLGGLLVAAAGAAGICHALVFSEWLSPGRLIVYRFFRRRVFMLDQSRLTVRRWMWFYYRCRVSAPNGDAVLLTLLTDAEVKLLQAYIDASSPFTAGSNQ